MNIIASYKVKAQDRGLKISDICMQKFKMSTRNLRRVKQKKLALLNGESGSLNRFVKEGDMVSILNENEKNIFSPEPIDFGVIYEDKNIIAVDKPPFLVVHPTKNYPSGTLGNAIAHYQKTKNEDYKIRFINRLDRDTSGVMLVAKTGHAQHIVSTQMKLGTEKYYLAIVVGRAKESGIINAPIRLMDEDSPKRGVMPDGKSALTTFKKLESIDLPDGRCFSLLKIRLHTGRTHQIRVHMAYIGLPILGDGLYGQPSDIIKRHALHSSQMIIDNVDTDDTLVLESPMPEDMQLALSVLRSVG